MNSAVIIRKIFRRLYSKINLVYYRLKFFILGKKVIWGKSINICGRLDISGPGTVYIGDNVYINGEGGRPVTPYTHHEAAKIIIGNGTFLNNTRFGCANEIKIGTNCIVGESNILDTDFHPVDPESRRRDEPGRVGKVILGDNVWIGGAVIILKNTVIGCDSTVGAGSVVSGTFPDRSLVAGNPAKIIRRLA